MSPIIKKETRLAASVLSYLFIAFSFMTLLPGYPILCGAFFVTLGIFQSYQSLAANNDIVFSALLPIAKRDVVKGKYIFAVLIELCSFAITAVLTLLRMTLLKDSQVYITNALMTANLFSLGAALVIFGLFNWVFIGGFFKTAYRFGKPFVVYIIIVFVFITLCEALHYIPGLEAVNSFGFENIGFQSASLAAGSAAFALITFLSCRKACSDFEKIDL